MFLNVIWRAAWRVSFHQRYLFYNDVMLSCSEKKLCVQVVVTIWVTETNKIFNVAILKDGKVCSDVKYPVGSLILKSVFLSVF